MSLSHGHRFGTVLAGAAVVAAVAVVWSVAPGPSTVPSAVADDQSSRVVVAHRPALDPALPSLTVRMPDLAPDGGFSTAQQLNGFGCTGGNVSPALSWTAGPPGTRSYLVSMFDADAPTSSGFWHWLAWNIPSSTTSVAAGAGTGPGRLPAPAVNARSDYGDPGYGGACPPPGGPPQDYVFSVVALDVADLGLPPDLPAAAVQIVVRDHALAFGTHVVRYHR